MINVDASIKADDLAPLLDEVFALAKTKVAHLNKTWDPEQGSPVFTVRGKYTTRGWTEWTQGFMYGCQVLVFDGTEDEDFLIIPQHQRIEYRQPAFLDDELEILVWYSDLEPIKGLGHYQIKRATDGELLAQAQSLWICINQKTGQPTDIPENFLKDLTNSQN